MKLVIKGNDGWYTIERAEHAGVVGLRPIGPGSMSFVDSSRISDADVEGPLDEMRQLAIAIRARESFSAKRCAVDVRGNEVLLWSPRNSQKEAVVTIWEADDLAAQIEALPDEPDPLAGGAR